MPERLRPAFFCAPDAHSPRSPPVPGSDVKGLAQPAFVQAPDAPGFQTASQPGEAVRAPVEAQGSYQPPLTNNLPSEVTRGFPSPQESFAEIKHARRQLWEATGYVPPIVGGAPDNPTETPEQENDGDSYWPPRPGDTIYGNLGLQRDRDLSPGANWLVERLLGGGARDYGEELDYLQWYADKQGIDLQAAIDELNSHGLLVSRKPGWIDLPKKVLPRKDRRKK